MKNVKLELDGYWIDVEDGWLCIGNDENQVILKPKYFKKLLAAINYTPCCKSDSELLCDSMNIVIDEPISYCSKCCKYSNNPC